MTTERFPENPTDEERHWMAVRVAEQEQITVEEARKRVDAMYAAETTAAAE